MSFHLFQITLHSSARIGQDGIRIAQCCVPFIIRRMGTLQQRAQETELEYTTNRRDGVPAGF